LATNEFSKFYNNFNQDTSPESIKTFIELGGDINEQASFQKWTLLNLAIEKGNIQGIKTLIEYGANIDVLNSFPPIFHAVDVDVDSCWQLNHSFDGLSFSTLILLLNLGADWELKNTKGETIRDVASAYGEVVLNGFDELVLPHCK